jgi:hypothetical protein
MTGEEYAEWFKSELIDQLMDSERFEQFVKFNYDIQKVVDEDTKDIRLQVMEVPHTVAQDRIAAALREQMTEEDGKIMLAGADTLAKLDKG